MGKAGTVLSFDLLHYTYIWNYVASSSAFFKRVTFHRKEKAPQKIHRKHIYNIFRITNGNLSLVYSDTA